MRSYYNFTRPINMCFEVVKIDYFCTANTEIILTGLTDETVEINRAAALLQIKEQLLSLFPENIQQLLRMSEFTLCRCAKSKKLEDLSVNNNSTYT